MFTLEPSGSTASLDDASSPTPSFVPDVLGTYQLQVTVTDDEGAADTDTVAVTVQDTTPPSVIVALVPVLGDDEGLFRVEFGCSDACDQNPQIVATLNGVPVTNGQVVELEFDDDMEVDYDDGVLEIEAPSFVLRVVCEDASGNAAESEVALDPPPDDDDDDDERRQWR